jgi:hypothetical protein
MPPARFIVADEEMNMDKDRMIFRSGKFAGLHFALQSLSGARASHPGSDVMSELWQQVGFDLLMVAVGCVVVILVLFFVLT